MNEQLPSPEFGLQSELPLPISDEIETKIESLRSQLPSLEKMMRDAGKTVKILAAVSVLGAAQAEAQQSSIMSDSEMIKVVEMLRHSPLDQAVRVLDGQKFHFSKDHKTVVVSRVEEKNEGPIRRSLDGVLPENGNSIGDLEIILADRHAIRSEQTITERLDENIESIAESVTEAGSAEKGSIEGTGRIMHATGTGSTREDAIIEALRRMSEEKEVHILNIQTDQSSSTGPNTAKQHTSVSAIDGLNYFKDIRILSAHEVQILDQKYIEVKIEAEAGKPAQAK